MFDFRRATIFLFGTPLLKHKMTRYAKNFGGNPGYANAQSAGVKSLHSNKSFFASDIITNTLVLVQRYAA